MGVGVIGAYIRKRPQNRDCPYNIWSPDLQGIQMKVFGLSRGGSRCRGGGVHLGGGPGAGGWGLGGRVSAGAHRGSTDAEEEGLVMVTVQWVCLTGELQLLPRRYRMLGSSFPPYSHLPHLLFFPIPCPFLTTPSPPPPTPFFPHCLFPPAPTSLLPPSLPHPMPLPHHSISSPGLGGQGGNHPPARAGGAERAGAGSFHFLPPGGSRAGPTPHSQGCCRHRGCPRQATVVRCPECVAPINTPGWRSKQSLFEISKRCKETNASNHAHLHKQLFPFYKVFFFSSPFPSSPCSSYVSAGALSNLGRGSSLVSFPSASYLVLLLKVHRPYHLDLCVVTPTGQWEVE
ncbi:uncharacterized protein LOC127056026 [Gopherus flavomarginatus]|uniref:uncharacterized protein LOC127056026 n=1 Tax=Gopherus flavomarginatus TaxID=286002 RepID=UPI0021CC0277|nr:uncharacterized protein LOC127056026 [Gopherus flavomarginatus]